MDVNGTDMLYMDDMDGNYLRSFDATVMAMRRDDAGQPYLVLDRSAFYPEGGGQPSDTGTITPVGPGIPEQADPLSVFRVVRKNEIRHYIDGDRYPGTTPITPGTRVRGEIHWPTRYAHMRMHTAQHLVSAVVYDLYSAATVGNQIHAVTSRIDFSPLSHDEVDPSLIQNRCSELIRANPPVLVMFRDRSEIEGTRDAERCNLHLIPDSVRELRIVKIQEVELCPCAGTHIRTLGEVKGITIDSVRSKGRDKVRLTYELDRE